MLVEAGVIAAVAAGTLAQAVSGLGQALVAGPILILVVGAADGVRIALLTGLALNLAVALTRPRSVRIGPAVRLFAPAVLVLIPLALLVSGTSSAPLRVAAGVAIFTGAALLAFGRQCRWLATPSGTAVAGGVALTRPIMQEVFVLVLAHRGRRPDIHPSAYVAPNATVCGDVRVAAGARILFGAVLSAEDGSIEIGQNCVVMEHALVRGRREHPAIVGRDVLIGPHAHVNGARVGDGCFLATGSSVFPGASLGRGAEVRINGVVHVKTVLGANTVVPIGWVAVGDPATVLAPDRHDDIWAIQQNLNFEQTVYGAIPGTTTAQRMAQQSAWFGAHADDQPVAD